MDLHSTTATKAIGAGGLLGILAASWFLVLGPQADGISSTHDAIAETRSQSDALRAQVATLEEQQRQLGSTREADRALGVLFPETADQPRLFQYVNRAAARAGVPPAKVTTVAPTAPVLGDAEAEATEGAGLPAEADSSDLARQDVTITVEAGYTETQQMLDHLEDMPRAYLVDSLSVGAGTNPQLFLTTITGDMFVMSPAPAPKSS